MKKLVSILCVLMTFSMLVSCGGTNSVTNSEPKTSTKKTENVVNTQKTEQVVDIKTTKPAETPKIDEKKEQILIELMTLKNLCLFEGNEDVKVDRRGYYNFGVRDFIDRSEIFDKELKNKLLKPINELQNGDSYLLASKFNAVLDVEIEKHKLP